MKRILGALLSLLLIASASAPSFAKGQKRNKANRAAATRYDDSRRVYYDYEDDRYDERYEDDRSIWERSRDKVTVAGGAAAGAVIGGVAGGKKGALIGAIVGGAGSAIYTYKVRDREDERYRRY